MAVVWVAMIFRAKTRQEIILRMCVLPLSTSRVLITLFCYVQQNCPDRL